MQVLARALSILCLLAGASAGGAAASSNGRGFRGGDDGVVEPNEQAADRELQSVGPIDDEMMGIDEQGYYKTYQTGSCTCAKDAYLAVYAEARAHIKMIPLVQETDVKGTDSVYYKLENEINRLVDYAVCILHAVDCGCDDAPYGKHPFKIFNKYKVSTYQCCCDVNAIRDLIINGIKELGGAWEIGHDLHLDDAKVHKKLKYGVFDRVVHSVQESVEKVGEVYITDHCNNALCPDNSLIPEDFVVDETKTEPFICDGMSDTDQCIRICTEKGNSACVVSRMPNATMFPDACLTTMDSECPPDHHCIFAGRLGYVCAELCSSAVGTGVESVNDGPLIFG